MRKLFFCLFLAGAIRASGSTTFNLTNAQANDVSAIQGIIDNSATLAGDIIVIPAGTHPWTNSLKITKQITVQGPPAAPGAATAVITGGATTGRMIEIISNGGAAGVADHNTLTVKDLELVYNNTHSGICITVLGTARYHTNAGNPAGGIRVGNVHFSLANPTGGLAANMISVGDWNSGVIDHCHFDFPKATVSKAVIDIGGPATAPGTRFIGSTFYTIHGDSIQPTSGLYSASVAHNWGTIGGGADAAGLGGVSEDDQWYIEDNILEKIGINNSFTDNTSADSAGARVVFRHNSIWTQASAHGFGESGSCNSATVLEFYNNFYRFPLGKSPASTPTFTTHNMRTAGVVSFNERWQDEKLNNNGTVSTLEGDYFRFGLPGTPSMIGVADGTNFFDKNHSGSLTWTNHVTGGAAYAAITPIVTDLVANGTADTRIGSVYARGNFSGAPDGSVVTPADPTNGSNAVKLKSSVFANADLGKFVGFVIRNSSSSAPASAGAQTAAPAQFQQLSGIIAGSPAATGTGNNEIAFIIQSSFQSDTSTNHFKLAADDAWELRYIDDAIGMPGYGGLNGRLSGSAESAGTGHPPYEAIHWLTSATITGAPGNPVNQYYIAQKNAGLWSWNNRYRRTTVADRSLKTAEPVISNSFKTLTPGGIHGTAVSTDGVTGPKPGYPQITTTTANRDDYCRIGADWNSGHFGGFYADGTPVKVDSVTGQAVAQGQVGTAPPTSIPRGSTDPIYGGTVSSPAGISETQVYGAPYRHPLVTGIIASTPTITSTNGTTFTVCSGCTNTFTVTTGGFTGTPTLSIGSWSPSVSNVTFTNNGDGTATISGSASGTSAGDHTATITAHHTGETDATQSFTLTVNSNTPPTCSISTTGTTFFESDTVQVTITSGDTDGTVAKVELYSDDVKIATINNPESTEVFNWNAASTVALTAGSHVLKAQATDNGAQASPFSSTITLTIQPSVAQPTPPGVFQIRP